jgi:hypothetical protein
MMRTVGIWRWKMICECFDYGLYLYKAVRAVLKTVMDPKRITGCLTMFC